MNISAIGGDLRIAKLVEMYAKDENINKIYTYGLEKYFEEKNSKIKQEHDANLKPFIKIELHEDVETKIIMCNNLEEALQDSNIVISAMPFSKDNVNINAPFSANEITIDSLIELLKGKTFIAGGIPDRISNETSINCIDLLKNEELTILNAIPTVEGAIRLAIEKREETIHESNVLICGFGRIGKILCDRFKALGANVYCSARKEADLAWIREKRYIPLKYSELSTFAPIFDIVINTVPTVILNEKELRNLKDNALVIELASKPGGIDLEWAKKLGIRVVLAPGIPGKEMPKTAAKYIKNVVNKFLIKFFVA